MAVDEALLQSATEGCAATLRFYEWEQPTLSLGHFQNPADRNFHQPSRPCPLVRRASGGGAILHDRELTYSLVMQQSRKTAAARDLYELAHRSLMDTLARLGVSTALHRDLQPCSVVAGADQAPPFLCFQRRSCFDVICAGGKIVGSAQRRKKETVLQHGSILLAASERAPELPGILELAGIRLEYETLSIAWAKALAAALDRPTLQGDLTTHERRLASDLAARRFSTV